MPNHSLVILMPVLNDWESIAALLPAIDKAIAPMKVDAKVVIVDDGSYAQDGKDKVLKTRYKSIKDVFEVKLGSNQGNQRALAIGIAYVSENHEADYLVVMDSDMEDKAEDIPVLIEECIKKNNQKLIFAQRTKRSEGFLFRGLYQVYKKLYRLTTGHNIAIGNFSVCPWPLVRRLGYIADLWNHFPASIMRAKIPFAMVPTERGERIHGKSGMNIVNLVLHAFSGFTVFADIVAVRIMIFAMFLGALLIFGVANLIATKLTTDIALIGWTSQMVALFVVMLFQILSAAGALLMMVLSLRVRQPMLPIHDYQQFIMETKKLLLSK